MLDVVVDSHFEAVEALDDRLERIIEDELFDQSTSTGALQQRVFELSRDLGRTAPGSSSSSTQRV